MQVEFLVLKNDDLVMVLDSLYKDIIKEYSAGRRVAVFAPITIVKQLDEMLWQDGEESFIPHHCAINAKDYNSLQNIPILITDNVFLTSNFDNLINLTNIIIDHNKISVNNLVEVVYQKQSVLDNSRKKYVYYKNLGLSVKTIQK